MRWFPIFRRFLETPASPPREGRLFVLRRRAAALYKLAAGSLVTTIRNRNEFRIAIGNAKPFSGRNAGFYPCDSITAICRYGVAVLRMTHYRHKFPVAIGNVVPVCRRRERCFCPVNAIRAVCGFVAAVCNRYKFPVPVRDIIPRCGPRECCRCPVDSIRAVCGCVALVCYRYKFPISICDTVPVLGRRKRRHCPRPQCFRHRLKHSHKLYITRHGERVAPAHSNLLPSTVHFVNVYPSTAVEVTVT